MRVKFGPWQPDQADLDQSGLEECVNCMPRDSGYESLRDAQTLSGTNSISLSVLGSMTTYSALVPDTDELYVGTTAGHVYRFTKSTDANITRTTMDRTATYTGVFWNFARFGSTVLAGNGTDAMQIALPTYQSGNRFRDQSASASAPVARHMATVRDFVFAGRIVGAGNRVQWCQINNPQRWTPSPRLQSDFQDLPDSGEIRAMTGGDFAAIFTERSVWRATYVGSPVIFRFDEVAPNVRIASQRSAARHQNLTFFLSDAGFQVFDGQQCIPIGRGKVDRYVLDGFVATQSGYVGVVDSFNELYIVSLYPQSNELLLYNFRTGNWGRVAKTHHFITQAPSITTSTTNQDRRLRAGMFVTTGGEARYTEFNASAYMTATFATGEAQIFPDKRAFVTGVRPLIQGDSNTSVTVEVGGRNRLTETASYAAAVAVNSNGIAPLRSDKRYHRVRVKVSGGFSRAVGFDLDAKPGGKR